MTSNYMPDVVVEVAFDSGYTTADADRTWTDVSDYVELEHGMGTTFGRQDELSTADANSLTLTLDNSDGRFTANRAASPYYPNVKIGRPIRVTATPPGGAASTRFVGFVDQWPVEWDGTDAYAKAAITATSRLARLGVGQKMRSVIEHTILDTAPTGYWTLGDPSGSVTASESSGNSVAPLAIAGSGAAVVFGNAIGPRTDGLTAATFAGGQYLSAQIEAAGCSAIRFALQVSALPSPGSCRIAEIIGGNGQLSVDLSAGGSLFVEYFVNGVSAQLNGPTLAADDAVHDVVLLYVPGSTTWRLYVDGVNIDSDGTTALSGSCRFSVGGFVVGLTGNLSHVAFYAGTLDESSIPGMWEAVSGGFAGDRTDERLERILGWAGVAASEIDTAVGDETMTYQQTSGQSVVDALRDVESTEGGVLFDGADGRLTFHNRSHRYTAPVAVTFDMAEQQVESDYAPKLDRSTLTNDVTVDNPTTGETARSVDAASVAEYGTATSSAKSVAASYDPLQQKAAWLVASYAEPRPRVPSLTVDVLAQTGGTPSSDDILALTIGSRIQVVNQPAQADTTTADYFVEGYTESIGPESYFITFNLSPTYPTLDTLVLNSATRGLLDTGLLAL